MSVTLVTWTNCRIHHLNLKVDRETVRLVWCAKNYAARTLSCNEIRMKPGISRRTFCNANVQTFEHDSTSKCSMVDVPGPSWQVIMKRLAIYRVLNTLSAILSRVRGPPPAQASKGTIMMALWRGRYSERLTRSMLSACWWTREFIEFMNSSGPILPSAEELSALNPTLLFRAIIKEWEYSFPIIATMTSMYRRFWASRRISATTVKAALK